MRSWRSIIRGIYLRELLSGSDAGFVGFVFEFGCLVHGLCAELELDASAVECGDDVDALVARWFGVGDVVFECAVDDVVGCADGVEAAIDVEFVLDDDAHAVEVVEIGDGGTASEGFFFGAIGGFDAVIDDGRGDAAVL